MNDVIWYRGKAKEFDDEDAAADWMKEIDKAKKEKRMPDESKAKTAKKPQPLPPRVAARTLVEEPPVPATQGKDDIKPKIKCKKECDVTVEDASDGGILVTHRSRLGNLITGRIATEEEAEAWVEKTHAEEFGEPV